MSKIYHRKNYTEKMYLKVNLISPSIKTINLENYASHFFLLKNLIEHNKQTITDYIIPILIT